MSSSTTPRSAKRLKKRSTGPIPEHVHGTVGGRNNWGCKCESCTAAYNEWMRRYKSRKKAPAEQYLAAMRRMHKADQAEQARRRREAIEADRVELLTAMMDLVA